MGHPMLLLGFALALSACSSSVASAKIVEHCFHVGNLTITRLCEEQVIVAVNGGLPGPTIEVYEGDTLIVHVFNESPYNLTIHWHGIFQLQSGWADGPVYITQCPILPGNKYTYRFTITGQEGTLWWHAHYGYLRATVYGALIIRPRMGEWWNTSVYDVETEALASGGAPNISNAFTINGQPGDLYSCSSEDTYKVKVVQGETYLLRIINAALNNQLFFKIANHTMTVVAVDGCYTSPMVTDTIVIAPGQTVDALLTADQPLASYYMAAHAYDSVGGVYDSTNTTGIIVYENATSSTPLMPTLPDFNDTSLAFQFYSNLTSLMIGPYWEPVPVEIDQHMFVTEGLGLVSCGSNNTCEGPLGLEFAGSMNNESFELPTELSILQAFFYNISGIYTTDFPSDPPLVFDYTDTSNTLNTSLVMTTKSTKVTKLKFNSTVQIVFQNTALVGTENHPIHLHGFNFYVLAQGFGNYDNVTGPESFNLVNPQKRNTIGVPVGGWAVIRFVANNPGTFSLLDLSTGLIFITELFTERLH
ncbi:hypothetical protein RHMOL_Rhmol05G0282300 [Rhododendron molle]|uniref:Uncharacterized protein n=1 Tax=Rhododendron molle TaxID=49168 RepID=A0ACC0NUY7_RHOML|nr:hypothetical protein RHMOL_Rhmol05G0282300 [Rhododendron molle]